MTKQEFIDGLRNGLAGYPQEDIDGRLAFYSEMIDDRMEEGLGEEEAVEELGPVEKVVEQIVSELPLPRLVKAKIQEKIEPGRRPGAWLIVLLVLGAPLWIPLLLAAFAVVLAAYIVIWAVTVAFWAVWIVFIACALAGIAAGILLAVQRKPVQGLLLISAGIVLAGLSIFTFFACRAATKGAAFLTKKMALGIKSKLRRKEAA